MISITEHIQYLILRHDCVIVPGFGALVAQYEPARMSADGLSLMPPRRVLGFNGAVQHDDGLLIGSVARREGLSYDAARMEVEREVLTLRHRLDAGNEVALPRIGTFECGASGAGMTFVPVVESGIADALLCGLPQLLVSPLAGAGVAGESQVLEGAPRRVAGRRFVSVMKYAASVAVLVGLGLTFTTPLSVDMDSVDFAALATPKVKLAELPKVSDDAGRELYIVIPDAREATAEVTDKDYSYYLVIASCANRNEALRFIERQGDIGMDMSVLASGGRHRVYVRAGNDMDALNEFRSTNDLIKKKYADAWIYHYNR